MPYGVQPEHARTGSLCARGGRLARPLAGGQWHGWRRWRPGGQPAPLLTAGRGAQRWPPAEQSRAPKSLNLLGAQALRKRRQPRKRNEIFLALGTSAFVAQCCPLRQHASKRLDRIISEHLPPLRTVVKAADAAIGGGLLVRAAVWEILLLIVTQAAICSVRSV